MMEDPERRLIRERAAEWVCELSEGGHGRAQRAAFGEWVRQSPRHIEEFLFAAAAWKALDAVGPREAQAVEQAVAVALAGLDVQSRNVVALPQAARPHVAAAARTGWTLPGLRGWLRGRHAPLRVAAGVAAMVLLGVAVAVVVTVMVAIATGIPGGRLSDLLTSGRSYVTAGGEQRVVRLDDGSVMYLNTESRVRVRYSGRGRDVRLTDGEALFVVARNEARPFRVTAGATVVQAVGTQFNVRQRSGDTTVSVLEGRVKVLRADAPTEQSGPAGAAGTDAVALPGTVVRLLDAGQQATLAGDGRIVVRVPQEVSDVVAWRERRLVFRGDALADIVEEINRYSPRRRFEVRGEQARSRRIAGTFSADDPQALMHFLRQYDDLSVTADDDRVLIRAR